MAYPFPGMNPWLETSRLWRDVHQRLITNLAELLAPQLEPRYFVGVETHTYISITPSQPLQTRYPDVSILHRGGPAVATAPNMTADTPQVIEIPLPEPYEEPYLEVRLLPDGEVVTVIELLSHTNKRSGSERAAYLEKRDAFIKSELSFIEIDLLRAGQPMPYTDYGADYRILVRRSEVLHRGHLYSFSVRQPIPRFPLPLLPDDQEPIVDLGALLQEVYDRARYKLVIDYQKPPEPPLSDEDTAWARQCLNEVVR
ncbi:MAG: DUF4058 family protein [Caldilineaceae bacterium]